MVSKCCRLAVLSASLIPLLFITGCSTPVEPEGLADIYVDDGVVHYSGPLNTPSFNHLRELFEQDNPPRILAVNSVSGDPMAAMQIGYLLQRHQVTLRIRERCEGLCANYLFTAASVREVYPEALITWSGGALNQSVILQWESYILPGIRDFVTRYSDQYLRRETRFFERVSVDQHITIYGFHPRLGCMDYERFNYSWPDLVSLGIGETRFVQHTYKDAFSHADNDICRVDLSNRHLLLNEK
ncbi:hypothetical protein FM042_00345 [Aliidiomarina halalkaliphila]|uniref:Uncharacterized protein n=1 Tax=Aliidiomarina halalkaliphila TaxID=2593535 RepID=A0A552X2V0_9GAMM|nr:hypothetical protein [Aliidiomarina halalkaliphila]TRW49357.1 hypothetical protein FM042_00345 [Aliidiomarina halalkaliphila]